LRGSTKSDHDTYVVDPFCASLFGCIVESLALVDGHYKCESLCT